MLKNLKRNIYMAIFGLMMVVWCVAPLHNVSFAAPPKFQEDVASKLTDGRVVNPDKAWVEKDKTLRQNIVSLFYPSESGGGKIYEVVRTALLWIMIGFVVWAGASILFNRKPEDIKKTLRSLVYILLWWVFVYAANRIFGSVLHFNNDSITWSADGTWWIWGVTNAFVWENSVLFVVLSALKWFAFFLAIIMTVITWFRVIAAWDGEKWKKLVKWLINVVEALLIIKWIDFIYYLAADSWNFVNKATDFIINVARIFGYLYWWVIVLMVFVAWYLYIIDGWSWSQFKKASNILVNILLSALVLFAFLLILYQIFAEFSTWGDAVADVTAFISQMYV